MPSPFVKSLCIIIGASSLLLGGREHFMQPVNSTRRRCSLQYILPGLILVAESVLFAALGTVIPCISFLACRRLLPYDLIQEGIKFKVTYGLAKTPR